MSDNNFQFVEMFSKEKNPITTPHIVINILEVDRFIFNKSCESIKNL